MNSPVQIWRNHKKLHQYLGKTGKVITWTKIYVAPKGFEKQVPYAVAIIEFEDGQRLPLQVVDLDHELKVGEKVITCVRRIVGVEADEVIEYVIKAKPI